MRDVPGGYEFLGTLQDEEYIPTINTAIERQLYFASNVIGEWERNGVTVLVWNWHDDFKDNDTYENLFKNRHVPIHLDGTDYFCLTDIIGHAREPSNLLPKELRKLTTREDFSEKGLQKNDDHLNKEGNQVISDSIYIKMQELKNQGKKQINQNLI